MTDDIFHYFKEQLDHAPDDPSLKELPIDSECGEDCKGAIDAAKQLMHYAKLAGVRYELVKVAEDIVCIFWRG